MLQLILSVCYGHWGMYNVYLLPRECKFQNLNLLKSLPPAWQFLLLRVWPKQDWTSQWGKETVDFRSRHLPHCSWGRPGVFLTLNFASLVPQPFYAARPRPSFCFLRLFLLWSQRTLVALSSEFVLQSNLSICSCSVILS